MTTADHDPFIVTETFDAEEVDDEPNPYGMTEFDTEIADTVYEAMMESMRRSDRSAQAQEFRVGISDFGYCSERLRRFLDRQIPDDTDMLAAWIGTWLGTGVEESFKVAYPEAVIQTELTITLHGETNTYVVPGHPDIIYKNAVIDAKSANGLVGAARTGMTDQQKRFQRHCLDPRTPILMDDLTWKPIGELAVGDMVKSVDEHPVDTGVGRSLRRWRDAEVQAVWRTTKPAYRMTLNDGTEIIAGHGHRFLSRANGSPNWRWRKVEKIGKTVDKTGSLRIARPYLSNETVVDPSTDDYKAGYLVGMNLGDGWARLGLTTGGWGVCQSPDDDGVIERVMAYAEHFGVRLSERIDPPSEAGWQKEPIWRASVQNRRGAQILIELAGRPHTDDWKAGWMSGLYDADGTLHPRGSAVVYQKDRNVLLQFEGYAKEFGYDTTIREPNAITIAGPITTQAQFLSLIQPALTRKTERLVGRTMRDFSEATVVSVEAIGEMPLVDITTSTATFIAAGVVSHNCYGFAAWTDGLLGDIPIENVLVGNLWIDRSGGEKRLLVRTEPLDMEVIEEATRWLDEVVYNWQRGTEAEKEPAREVCATTCGFFTVCRAFDTDVQGLITDPVKLDAVAMHLEGSELKRRGNALQKAAKDELAEIVGSTGEDSVRWVHVAPSFIEGYKRAGYSRLQISKIKRDKPKKRTTRKTAASKAKALLDENPDLLGMLNDKHGVDADGNAE